MYAESTLNGRSKAIRITEKNFIQVEKMLPQGFKIPNIVIVDFNKNGINPRAIAGYYSKTDTIFINSKYDTLDKILKFVNKRENQFANNTVYALYLHELGHKFYEDFIKKLAKSKNKVM